tara:strand:+ start:1042 stop:2217 length:1176 start_codon:yes stop_codon:yes gene_type:complete
MNKYNYFKLNSSYLAIFLFGCSILFYSPTPLVIATLLFLPVFLIYFYNVKLNKLNSLVILFCLLSIPSISNFFSLTETFRFIALVALFMVFYLIGTKNSSSEKYFKILTLIFYCCAFVAFYYYLVILIRGDNSLIDERRYYQAREFLFFGREYDFQFGITHLNFYTSYCLLYSIIRALLLKQKSWYLVVLVFLTFSFLSESRGPVLFSVIVFLSIWACLRIHRYKSFKIPFLLFFSIVALLTIYAPVFWEILKEQGNAGNYRLFTAAVTDLSRISYFLLGIEHLIAKPFGNVLIYTADTDLQNYHNTFLTIANRNGIIACSLFIVIVLFSFAKSIAHLKDNSPTFLSITPILIFLYCLFFFNIDDVMRFDRLVYLLLAFQIGVGERLYKMS